MIIKWQGGMSGTTDDTLRYNIDLCPTVADLLGVQKAKNWDGESYAPAIKDGTPCPRDYLVLSQMAHVCREA